MLILLWGFETSADMGKADTSQHSGSSTHSVALDLQREKHSVRSTVVPLSIREIERRQQALALQGMENFFCRTAESGALKSH